MPIKYTPASSGGNADTATALATARAINGVNFDGSAPVTVTAAAGTLSGDTLKATVVTSSLTTVGTIGTGTWNGTAIASSYIAADAVTGAKIADDAINSEHYTDASVDFAHIQNVAANSILGRNANSSGVVSEVALTTTQILIGDGTGFTAAALSGQATMTNAGVVTVNSATLDSTPSDGVYNGIYASFTAGETITRGEIVYLVGDADNTVELARASDANKMPAVAIATADVANSATGIFMLFGVVHDTNLAALTRGHNVYVSRATDGAAQAGALSATGDLIQIIGVATHADKMVFNPSYDIVEHA